MEQGFRCFVEPNQTYCSDEMLDTWYIFLICSDKQHGKTMLDRLKQHGREAGVNYITLSAVESVVIYYWSVHNFKISTDCHEDAKITSHVKTLNDTIRQLRDLDKQKRLWDSEIETVRSTRRNSRNEIKLRSEQFNILLDEIKRLKIVRSKELLSIVNSGMYTVNLKTNGASASQNYNAKMQDASDGIYMTLCLNSNEVFFDKKTKK